MAAHQPRFLQHHKGEPPLAANPGNGGVRWALSPIALPSTRCKEVDPRLSRSIATRGRRESWPPLPAKTNLQWKVDEDPLAAAARAAAGAARSRHTSPPPRPSPTQKKYSKYTYLASVGATARNAHATCGTPPTRGRSPCTPPPAILTASRAPQAPLFDWPPPAEVTPLFRCEEFGRPALVGGGTAARAPNGWVQGGRGGGGIGGGRGGRHRREGGQTAGMKYSVKYLQSSILIVERPNRIEH